MGFQLARPVAAPPVAAHAHRLPASEIARPESQLDIPAKNGIFLRSSSTDRGLANSAPRPVPFAVQNSARLVHTMATKPTAANQPQKNCCWQTTALAAALQFGVAKQACLPVAGVLEREAIFARTPDRVLPCSR